MKPTNPVRKLRMEGSVFREGAPIRPSGIDDRSPETLQDSVDFCNSEGRCNARENVVDDDQSLSVPCDDVLNHNGGVVEKAPAKRARTAQPTNSPSN